MASVADHKSGNPALRWADYDAEGTVARSESVTNSGVAFWSLAYIGIMVLTGAWAWNQTYGYAKVAGTEITALPPHILGYAIGAILIGFVIALVTIFVPRICVFTAPLYSACEGVSLGVISAAFEQKYPGVVLNTVLSTVGVFVTMAVLYGTGIIRVTEFFKRVILAAMFGIIVVYLVDILAASFVGYKMPMIHEQGNPWAIAFSVGVIIIAALNFAWDFQSVKDAQDQGAPKYYESYLAFGFMLTLVWLYLEILRFYVLISGDSSSSSDD